MGLFTTWPNPSVSQKQPGTFAVLRIHILSLLISSVTAVVLLKRLAAIDLAISYVRSKLFRPKIV